MSLRVPRLSFWRIIAGLIFAAGLYATWVRFAKGLGASTNLSDTFPWGLWIGFDVLIGVGLAAGGFVIAATVHIFNLKKYKPIVRPTILTAFLGYSMVILALMFDLGRPYRIWHPLVMWNPRSVMFEVAWCVMLYTFVLALEFSPIVFEKFRLKTPLKIIRSFFILIVVAGVLLSTLHQSSLGTLYVIVPDKLHGLWYSPLLPLFFFVSAIAVGLAMTIFESFLSYRAFGRHLEADILEGLARVIVVVLAVYSMLKLQDLSHRQAFPLLFAFTRESILFWAETGIGVVLPMILLFLGPVRRSQSGLFLSTLLVIVGFVMNRLNVSITGMLHSETYFPKWTELTVTISLVVLGFAIFGIAVNYFPVFSEEPVPVEKPVRPAFSGNVVMILWALLLLGLGGYSLTKKFKPSVPPNNETVSLSRSINPLDRPLKTPPDVTFPVQAGSPGPVTFSHERHLSFQAGPDCTPCHQKAFSLLRHAADPLKMETMSRGESCGLCHNGKQAFSASDQCDRCHQSPTTK